MAGVKVKTGVRIKKTILREKFRRKLIEFVISVFLVEYKC